MTKELGTGAVWDHPDRHTLVHFGSPAGERYEPIKGKPTEPKRPSDPGPQPKPEPAPVAPPKTRWWRR